MAPATATQSMGVAVTENPPLAACNTSMVVCADATELSRRRSKSKRPASRLPLRTAFRSFTGVVSIIVGNPDDANRPPTQYLVHKELLTSASPFFAAALNGTFTEGIDQAVRLPEEKPEIFEWFLHWLYTGSLLTPQAGTSGAAGLSLSIEMSQSSVNHVVASDAIAHTDGDLRNAAGSPKYFLLIDLWALSDRMLTVPLSNYILSTLSRLSEATNSVPTPSDTWILYDTIRDGCPLRTLVLDLFAYKKTDKLLETHKDEWHPKFLRELVVKLKRPGPEAVQRHSLVAWRPQSWSTTKACEGCKEPLKPGDSADKCIACDKAFCGGCLRRHGEPNGWTLPHDTTGCKPWQGKGMCARYHDHVDGETCG